MVSFRLYAFSLYISENFKQLVDISGVSLDWNQGVGHKGIKKKCNFYEFVWYSCQMNTTNEITDRNVGDIVFIAYIAK